MATTTQQQLAEALPNIGRRGEVTASNAHARHQAYLADIAEIGRQHAEAIKTAPGYSAKLGCIVGPKQTVAFINAQVEAGRPALKMAAE